MSYKKNTIITARNYVEEGRLRDAIALIEPNINIQSNSLFGLNDTFVDIKDSYDTMLDYIHRGIKDPERCKIYKHLQYKLFALLQDMWVGYICSNSSVFQDSYNRVKDKSDILSISEIRHRLEGFVSDVALTDLDISSEREKKSSILYQQHNSYMQDVFCSLMISRHWSENEAKEMLSLLVSPTVNSLDRQMIVSALSLNLLMFYDFQKFLMMIDVYLQSTDIHIRQRALVGWVLNIGRFSSDLFPEVTKKLNEIFKDESIRHDILELQIQLIYCRDAEQDTVKIQKEIIPDLMRNNPNLKITRFGIEEKDDSMQDILDPEASDRSMENIEGAMQKMMDMMAQGADIYFGGFAQMKKYPFFSKIANWFCPFYLEHPDLKQLPDDFLNGKLLHALLKVGPFCDSDKYSFAFTIYSAFSNMPENIKEVISNGDGFGNVMSEDTMRSPAYIRRIYLQDIFRFFRLFKFRDEFYDVFGLKNEVDEVDGATNRYLPLINMTFYNTELSKVFNDFAAFLLKKNKYDDLDLLLSNYSNDYKDTTFYKIRGTLNLKRQNYNAAVSDFSKVVRSEENDSTIRSLARAYLGNNDFEIARNLYVMLMKAHPTNISIAKKYCICLTNLHDIQTVLPLLYQLDYNNPKDKNIKRMLAWNQLCNKELDKAIKTYLSILSLGDAIANDYLYIALCYWFSDDAVSSINMLKSFIKLSNTDNDMNTVLLCKYLEQDVSLLELYGYSHIDVVLLAETTIANL